MAGLLLLIHWKAGFFVASSAVKKELDLELQQRIEEHLHRCPVQAWKVDQSNQIPNENLSDDDDDWKVEGPVWPDLEQQLVQKERDHDKPPGLVAQLNPVDEPASPNSHPHSFGVKLSLDLLMARY